MYPRGKQKFKYKEKQQVKTEKLLCGQNQD